MAFKKLKYWFDDELAILLAQKIIVISPNFPLQKFIDAVVSKIPSLELKDRVEIFADELSYTLGNDYVRNIKILEQILGPENEEETGMFTNYYWIMPIAKYVEKYGLSDFDISMQAISEITKRNTGEYAIRPFLEQDFDRTFKAMKIWSKSENKHIRRLSCEGLRPRLPWAKKLQICIDQPELLLPILNQLKNDSSKYVQNSVANCVNDILKDNFEIGQSLIKDWCVDFTAQRKWIIMHAIRNYRKQKTPWAASVIKKLN